MGLTVGTIALRLASLAGIGAADIKPAGFEEAILDAIQGAVDEMREAAPGLFLKNQGGVLVGPAAVTATIAAGTPSNVSLSAAAPNDGCTIRFAGVEQDSTLWDVSGLTARIAPGYAASITGSVAVAATVYHDAWRVGDGGGAVADVGSVVRVDGRTLEMVASREQAEERYGRAGRERRLTCAPDHLPHCWWLERSKAATLICVYPVPARRMAIEGDLVRGLVEVSQSQLFTSNETFDLAEDKMRLLWLPLAKLRFCGTPWFSNEKTRDEVERQGAKAHETLEKMKPRRKPLRDWNT